MTIATRLGYATRGFRGGENITQTLYINEEVDLSMQSLNTLVELESLEIAVEIIRQAEIEISLETMQVSVEAATPNVEVSLEDIQINIQDTTLQAHIE